MTIKEQADKIIFYTSEDEFKIIKEEIIYGIKNNGQITYDKKQIENLFNIKLEISLFIYKLKRWKINNPITHNKFVIANIRNILTNLIDIEKTYNGKSHSNNMQDNFKEGFLPYDFQKEHADFAINKKRSANFSSPGSGKTIIGLMSALKLFKSGKISNLVVFGPKSAAEAWTNEWEIIANDKHINIPNIEKLNLSDKQYSQYSDMNVKLSKDKLNIWFINYHTFGNKEYVNLILKHLHGEGVYTIFDEVHYLKNDLGNWHNAAKYFSVFSKYVTVLSGTPIPRDKSESYYLLSLLFPYIETKKLYKSIFNEFDLNKELIMNFINNIHIRMSKGELVKNKKLKELKEEKIYINISEVEDELMNTIRGSKYNTLLNEEEIEQMDKTLLLRRMQASSYPPLLLKKLSSIAKEMKQDSSDIKENAKKTDIDSEIEDFISKTISKTKFQDMIKKYDNGEKVTKRWKESLKIISSNPNERIIVWDIFRLSMKRYEQFLNKETNRKIFLINGTINKIEDRKYIIDKFKNTEGAILIASPATIAESASFHRECDISIYLYKNYVGSHWMQSKDRIHRLVRPGETTNQKKIYDLVCTGDSIDENIVSNLDKKEKQQMEIIGE